MSVIDFTLKKSVLILLIVTFSFLILEASRNMWVEAKLASLKKEMKETSFIRESSLEDLFAKLQRLSPKNANVWSLASRYYFKKMTQASALEERLSWVEKAYRSSFKALECNPFDRSSQVFLKKTMNWKRALSSFSQ